MTRTVRMMLMSTMRKNDKREKCYQNYSNNDNDDDDHDHHRDEIVIMIVRRTDGWIDCWMDANDCSVDHKGERDRMDDHDDKERNTCYVMMVMYHK